MPFTIKMLKEMLLQTSPTSQIFSVVTFIIVPTISEIILFSLTCQKIYYAFVITVKAMIKFMIKFM